jgi:hypothetical protein
VNDTTHAALLKAAVKGMPRFAFRTLDGLLALDDCPSIEDCSPVIMRWKRENTPNTFHHGARRYERTTELWMGLPVYREV